MFILLHKFLVFCNQTPPPSPKPKKWLIVFLYIVSSLSEFIVILVQQCCLHFLSVLFLSKLLSCLMNCLNSYLIYCLNYCLMYNYLNSYLLLSQLLSNVKLSKLLSNLLCEILSKLFSFVKPNKCFCHDLFWYIWQNLDLTLGL